MKKQSFSTQAQAHVKNLKESVLSGSNTTSCLHGRRKRNALKLLCKEDFHSERQNFLDLDAIPDEILLKKATNTS